MDDKTQRVKAEQAEIVENENKSSESGGEFIEQPAKVMRVGSMLRQLLDELREVQLDEGSRDRMRDIYDTSVQELGSALSSELQKKQRRVCRTQTLKMFLGANKKDMLCTRILLWSYKGKTDQLVG